MAVAYASWILGPPTFIYVLHFWYWLPVLSAYPTLRPPVAPPQSTRFGLKIDPISYTGPLRVPGTVEVEVSFREHIQRPALAMDYSGRPTVGCMRPTTGSGEWRNWVLGVHSVASSARGDCRGEDGGGFLLHLLHYSRGPRGTVPGTAGILAGRDAGGVGPQAAARQGRPALSDAHE